MYRHQTAVLAVIASLSCASQAFAARVTKVKGEQVLMELDGEGADYAEGGRYLEIVDGKRKAVVEISKIRGQRAIGKVLKGTAQEGGTLAPLSVATATKTTTTRAERAAKRHRSRKGGPFSGLSWGGELGYGSTSQNVTLGTGETVAMTGSSFSGKVIGDYPITTDFGLIGRVGFENFAVAGRSATLGDVKTSILYVDADLLLRYHFLEGNFHPFPLLGMGLHVPMSKTSGVLQVDLIRPTTIFFIGGGVNYVLSDSMYIHATAEYGYFPPSTGVTTSLIAIRAGVGFAL